MKKHIELNEEGSYFTANATYYFGESPRSKEGEHSKEAFLSISDCYSTIRLHLNTKKFNNEEMKKFKNKLLKLKNFINDFIEELPEN